MVQCTSKIMFERARAIAQGLESEGKPAYTLVDHPKPNAGEVGQKKPKVSDGERTPSDPSPQLNLFG